MRLKINLKFDQTLFKISLIIFLIIVSFITSSKASKADYMTEAQCTAAGGTCNKISSNCNPDQDSKGLCQGGPLTQGACCAPKTAATTKQASAAGENCKKINGSCFPLQTESGSTCGDDDFKGTMDCPFQEGCCVPKAVATTNNTSQPATSPSTPASSENTGGLVPCKNNCTLCHLIVGFHNIFTFLLGLLITATLLAITGAGVFYMVSTGNKGMMDTAKQALTYALTAFALGLGSWLVVTMILTAFGFNNAGSWWTFTCDATQSQGASSVANNVGTPGVSKSAGIGNGTCGGVGGQTSLCKYQTKELENLLSCIKGKVAMGDSANSKMAGYFIKPAYAASTISASYLNAESNLQDCAGNGYSKDKCIHMRNSCHWGGTNCAGQINAADLTGSDLNAIRQAATACGGFSIYKGTNYRVDGTTSTASDHGSHVHVSPMNSCGCQ
jgi:hypothetical protein